jgi:hypothetical protein
MGDRALLGDGLLAERPPARRFAGRLEDRVVAEAAIAPRTGGDPAPQRPADLGGDRQSAAQADPIGQHERHDADVARSALTRRQSGQRRQQLGVVVEIGGVLAGVAPGSDAGPAAQGVDLDPRVVGDRGQPCQAGVEAGLEPGIGLERCAVLDRIAGNAQRIEVDQLSAVRSEQLGQLDQLVPGARRDDDPGPVGLAQRRTPASASAWAANSRSRPVPARSSSEVKPARSKGLPSAVPCSST